MTIRLLSRPFITFFLRLTVFVTCLWLVGLLLARGAGTMMPGSGRIFFGSWFLQQEEYYIVDLERSLQMKVSHFPTCCYNWSPDRTQRALLESTGNEGGLDLYVTDAHGEHKRQLTDTPGAINTYPAWAPDNRRIAFVSTRDADQEIYVVDAQSRIERRLTRNALPEGAPVWSPDGEKIAFVSIAYGSRAIWVMDASGRNLHRLPTTTPEANLPAWSPDSRQIAFSSGSYTSSDIYVINVDGSGERQLTHLSPAETAWYPIWSLNGSQIAFIWSLGAERDIYVVNADGSNLHRLTHNQMDEDYIVWMQ